MARATTLVAGAVALFPFVVLQRTHHFSAEEPLLWATIDRQEGPVNMGCGVLECFAFTLATASAVAAFTIVSLASLAVDVLVFAAGVSAAARLAVEAFIATLAVAGNAVAAFDVALGYSSSSSTRGPCRCCSGKSL